MADENRPVKLKISTSFSDISPQQWACLEGTERKTSTNTYNPFISYDFLSSVEDSGCATSVTGWLGQHLTLYNEDGDLLGAAPCYLKNHSQGEYVFDHGWADAFERAGGHYYPKLQISVPFTPATGPRLLVRQGEDTETIQMTLARAIQQQVKELGISSAHVTFAQTEDISALEAAGYLLRTDVQFHFVNDNYADYEAFLSTLSSRKRKSLRKERREALASGIEVDWLTGNDLTEAVWDRFYEFYMETASRKWGNPYLNRKFFSLIGERMADDILLIMARREGRYIAGAINFIGSETLFGRNWGAIEHHPYLHFEICYHQAIEFAIKHGLHRVEAGAQGQHKLARGYLPVTTTSAHYIAHPALRRAVENYLKQERQDIEHIESALSDHSPFREMP